MVYCVSYTWWVFTVVCDDGGEVLGGLIYVGENFPFQCHVSVVSEVVPVCSIVVSVSAFGRGVIGLVECVCDESRQVDG